MTKECDAQFPDPSGEGHQLRMYSNNALAGITNSELHKPGITNLELCYVEF